MKLSAKLFVTVFMLATLGLTVGCANPKAVRPSAGEETSSSSSDTSSTTTVIEQIEGLSEGLSDQVSSLAPVFSDLFSGLTSDNFNVGNLLDSTSIDLSSFQGQISDLINTAQNSFAKLQSKTGSVGSNFESNFEHGDEIERLVSVVSRLKKLEKQVAHMQGLLKQFSEENQ